MDLSNGIFKVCNSNISIQHHTMESEPELRPVNEDSRLPPTMVYRRRWYVMIVFCLSAMAQGGSWSIFGPISAATEDAFGWKDSDIALLTAWGPIAYLISTFPFAWLIESKGDV